MKYNIQYNMWTDTHWGSVRGQQWTITIQLLHTGSNELLLTEVEYEANSELLQFNYCILVQMNCYSLT